MLDCGTVAHRLHLVAPGSTLNAQGLSVKGRCRTPPTPTAWKPAKSINLLLTTNALQHHPCLCSGLCSSQALAGSAANQSAPAFDRSTPCVVDL
jgi:hypothetical protein